MIFCFPLTGYKHRNLNIIIKASHWQGCEEGHVDLVAFQCPSSFHVCVSLQFIVTLLSTWERSWQTSLMLRVIGFQASLCSEKEIHWIIQFYTSQCILAKGTENLKPKDVSGEVFCWRSFSLILEIMFLTQWVPWDYHKLGGPRIDSEPIQITWELSTSSERCPLPHSPSLHYLHHCFQEP